MFTKTANINKRNNERYVTGEVAEVKDNSDK